MIVGAVQVTDPRVRAVILHGATLLALTPEDWDVVLRWVVGRDRSILRATHVARVRRTNIVRKEGMHVDST